MVYVIRYIIDFCDSMLKHDKYIVNIKFNISFHGRCHIETIHRIQLVCHRLYRVNEQCTRANICYCSEYIRAETQRFLNDKNIEANKTISYLHICTESSNILFCQNVRVLLYCAVFYLKKYIIQKKLFVFSSVAVLDYHVEAQNSRLLRLLQPEVATDANISVIIHTNNSRATFQKGGYIIHNKGIG